MKRFLLSAALLLACSGVALAQESEFSGGGGGGITAAPGSGTAGRIPQFASATSVVDSKMTASGTNSGTWTLYDDTITVGASQLFVKSGAGQVGTPQLRLGLAGANMGFGIFVSDGANYTLFKTGDGGQFANVVVNTIRGPLDHFYLYDDGTKGVLSLSSGSGSGIVWTSSNGFNGPVDTGLARSAAGILAVTDGSTGQGGIGLSDSATNTVSDALILRHQGGTVAGNGFGTGLKFQGENDAGTMHDMASIDAVWSLDDDTNEQSQFKFSTYDVGGELPILTLYKSGGETKLDAPYNMDLIAGNVLALYGATQLTFVTNGANKWIIPATGEFYPASTNTYDIGTSSAFVRNNYVSTSIQGTRDEVIPTDNVAENFVQISSATENAVTAGYIEYTVTAVDTTNEIIQTETGVVPFVAVNENTTVTSTLGTPYGVHQDNAGGAALAVSFAAVVTGTNVMMTVTSNYDQATLTGTVVNTLRYRVVLTSGTATVTPQT